MATHSVQGKVRQTKTPGVTRVIETVQKSHGLALALIVGLLFFVSGVWGACRNYGWGNGTFNTEVWQETGWGCENTSSDRAWCESSFIGTKAPSSGAQTSYGYCVRTSLYTSFCSANNIFCRFNGLCCDTQCERDSVLCVNDGKVWDSSNCDCKEQCDSTYHCESVFTENNVIRANVTLTDCHGTVLQDRMVLGSCSENGFCEGEQTSGIDSCSYSDFNPDDCSSGGQNGSTCTYICPDGQLYSCTIAWDPGTPASYQPCPSKPPSDCSTGARSSSSTPPPVDSIPDYPGGGSSSSTGGGSSDSSCPECDILEAIKDTLHRANEQRRFGNYVLDSIKNDVGGFGAKFDAITANTRATVSVLNTSNSNLSSIASTNSRIADAVEGFDLDSITATVDSVVVHVDLNQDTTPSVSWTFYDLDSLPVWRDTVSEVHAAIDSVRAQIDSLRNDSTGVLAKYLPFIKTMSDKLTDLVGDCEGMECVYKPVVDDLVSELRDEFGLDTVTSSEAEETEREIIRLSDSTYLDGNWYCIEHPDAEFCRELDSTELQGIKPPTDSAEIDSFFRWQDSLMAYYDSTFKDTTQDTIGLDELAGDSAKIVEKLGFLFLPGNTLEQCFEFNMNTRLGKWAYSLAIDFADLFGLDLCDLIRRIVRLLTFILIVFTTIKGFIRAFGGGGSS